MSDPVRSAALKRALDDEADRLPKDFAVQVARAIKAQHVARTGCADLALLGAFVLMVGICVVGWLGFGSPETAGIAWLDLDVRELASRPWLVTGVAGLAVVQLLTFGRRIMS